MMLRLLEASDSVNLGEAFSNLIQDTGIAAIINDPRYLIMIAISCFLIYLAVVKKFEPLLLLPIAFGMLLVNLPLGGLMTAPEGGDMRSGGLLYYLHLGVEAGIYPCLIFVAIGAMTDFGPLIANPKSLLLGAAAQGGIFVTFIIARLLGFDLAEAASIGIIGGAIFLTGRLAPHLLGAISVAAYSYMALVPFIQPPIMKLLTTKKERSVVMEQLRPVSRTEKILFPVIVSIVIILLLPSTAPLIGCLMLGNLIRESGVCERLSKTVQNEMCNIVTILLGVSVGATASADTFLTWETLKIIGLGLAAFAFATACGVLLGKLMCWITKGKINPLIGAAGVSAVPMAARVAQKVGQEENPGNFLLMHAMGPNVAGVIGSAVAAGVFMSLFG